MKNNLNLKELIDNRPDSQDMRKKVAKTLWPESAPEAQGVSMSNLINGNKKSIKFKWVIDLCDLLKVDPNTLFGYPWRKKVIIKKKNPTNAERENSQPS